MKHFLILFVLLMAATSFSQVKTENKVVRKINIKHIDPMLLSLILQGKVSFVSPSEISVISKN